MFSYDCQKNLVNPKVQDQIAYYSRQLYTYNFTIVQGSSHGHLDESTVFSYVWMEHEFAKGANQIASAVYHRLKATDFTQYKKIKLCSDGCGGQNRNSIVLGMVIWFLQEIAPKNILEIELVFPVTGHSFLPSDRVFGRIEKELKKIPVITDPETYVTIFKEHSTVTKLADIEVLDWKEASQKSLKSTGSWHIKFNEAKRFILRRKKNGTVLVQGEKFYNTDLGTAKHVFKPSVKGMAAAKSIQKGVQSEGDC